MTLMIALASGPKPNMDDKSALAAKICATILSIIPKDASTDVIIPDFWPYSSVIIC